MKKYGLIILAAGGSTRLGSPKQLLNYKNKNLLNHIVSIALKVEDALAAVVIGSQKERMLAALSPYDIRIIENDDWAEGMSSSIKKGLQIMVTINPEMEGCIITVCDQPFITLSLLAALITIHQQTSKGIIAASYAGTSGTPVLFHKKYFSELMELQNEEGAKKIVLKYINDLATIPFNGGEVDIDTKDDYKKLINADR